jgi:hypothetical protein
MAYNLGYKRNDLFFIVKSNTKVRKIMINC